MYINLLLDLSREDLRKLFWKYKNCNRFLQLSLEGFSNLHASKLSFFIIGRRKFLLQKRKFSGRLVSKFYLSMLLSYPPPLLKVYAANNFWKCYTSILFGKQNPDINQLVFEREIQLFQKRSKKVSMLRKMLTKVSELIITVSLRIKRIDLVRGRVKFKFVKLFYLISI